MGEKTLFQTSKGQAIKRREYLFLYDVKNANPNGDPLDENKPRMDEESGRVLVTDVRLKRVIRDTLEELGECVFLSKERVLKEDGTLKKRDELLKEFGNNIREAVKNVLNRCIDVRLFGATFAVESKKKKEKSKKKEENSSEQPKDEKEANNISLTGPVQFNFGYTLHRVESKLIKGTTILPSKEDKKQGTFTEMWIIPYGLIVFYGVANQFAAKDTGLTEEDLNKMAKAMWLGTKASTDVLSHSKMGHSPRLLIEVIYKEGVKTQMGELDALVRVEVKGDKTEEEIRDIEDIVVDLSRLQKRVERYKDKIEKVRYAIDDRIELKQPLEEVFKGIPLEEFDWFKEV